MEAFKRNLNKSKEGFTLIEMLVATTVLALGIMAIAGVFPMSLRVTENMRVITKGTAYAHQKMAELRTLSYNDPALDAGVHVENDTIEGNFIREYRVDDDFPVEGMKRVMVKVQWLHPIPDSIKIYSYITRN